MGVKECQGVPREVLGVEGSRETRGTRGSRENVTDIGLFVSIAHPSSIEDRSVVVNKAMLSRP